MTKTMTIRIGTVCDINDELVKARAKFPGNKHLMTALMEEVGELAKEFIQRGGDQRIYDEAKQVACVAVRIMEEGDPTYGDLTEAESLK